ncbi:MAG: CPBP family intramembrane metalloprotease [Candidatus Bathyarchaeota archaeon]
MSYSIVLLVAIFLLKKDSRKSLSEVFKNKGNLMIIIGLLFALIYLGLWYLISISLGSNITFESFPALRGFENYAIFSLPLAFSLYLGFSIFGAFAEEVTYRGYVQTRISSKYGIVLGVLVASLFFSLQHIHVFQANWLIQFFQTQFFHVFIFSIFSGYLYFKSNENIWSVITMHAFTNAFSVSVPIIVTHTFPFTFYIAEITSFTVMTLILRSLPLRTKTTGISSSKS